MAKTLIIGASGQIGKKITTALHSNGHSVVAMVRNADKAQEFSALGIETVVGDIEGDLGSYFTDCEKVVFTAGSGAKTGADKTLLVDLWGACKAVDAAKENKIRHFVMVSSRGADNPDKGPVTIKHYLVAKHFADNYLIASGLNFTILRPGRLLDETGTGLITITRPTNSKEQAISREDTAQAIYHCLTHEDTIGKIYELFKGKTPINTALVG